MPRRVDPTAAPGRSARVGAAAGIAIIVVAIATAVVFALPDSDDDAHVLARVVAIQEGAAPGTPPASVPDSFGTFAAAAGWRPVGARTDRVAGRDAATEIWDLGGLRVAHTRLSGRPLRPPEGARRTGRRGVLLHSVDIDGRAVVVWTDGGATSVISSAVVPRATLYDLAGGPPRER
jgi:hypothetical protein